MVEVTTRYSAIVPVSDRTDDLQALLPEYVQALETTGEPFEVIVVLDGYKPRWLDVLQEMCAADARLRVLELSRTFGQSSALAAGFDAAIGEVLITLPAYYQIEPAELPKLLEAHAEGDDISIAVRWPRKGGPFDRLRRGMFHRLFKLTSGMSYRDLGCGARVLKRIVAEEITLYGDQHRFLPALAARRGFRVREVEIAQSVHDQFRGRYRLRDYVHGVLDVLTVFFLVRFTKKPLRFFGTLGFLAASIGGLFTAVLIVQRLFFGVGLADRPALLLGSLMVVLGVQIFALGLIGELIIFTHAGSMKEYAIRSVIRGGRASPPPAAVQGGSAKRVAAGASRNNVTRLP